MTSLPFQRQAATVLAAVLAVTLASNSDKSISTLGDGPAAGPALAQGVAKFQGSALISELGGGKAMDDFAGLDDVYAVTLAAKSDESISTSDDGPAAGPSLAQGVAKFQGSAMISELGGGKAMDDFAGLDDIYDDSRYRDALLSGGLRSKDDLASLDDIYDDNSAAMQAEAWEFNVRKLLMNPSLYFTIAFVVGAGLLLTSSSDTPASEQRQAASRATGHAGHAALRRAEIAAEAAAGLDLFAEDTSPQ